MGRNKSLRGEVRRGDVSAAWDDLLRAHGETGTGEPEPDAGIVISIASGRCRVFRKGEILDCFVPGELAARQKSALAVGDRVILERAEGAWRLVRVLPRRSVLARPDPLRPRMQRLIAANIDAVIHVVTFRSPPLRPRLIDRFLIAVRRGGAEPLVCVNKIDLLDEEERRSEMVRLDPYRALGVPVIACSAKSGEGLDELRAAVAGKTCALVGHSGVGKSSILNALDERLRIATGEILKRGTGGHTTTAATLYDLGGSTYLIDTPGIREFGLWDIGRDALRDYFPEFEEPSGSCRFNDCTHTHEPECEVKRRVEAGAIDAARYDTYRRLYDDLGR